MPTTLSHSKRNRKRAGGRRLDGSTVKLAVAAPLDILPASLAEAADAAVAEAFARTYNPDPLIPEAFAVLRGPFDSVLRRHGLLIESAIATALEKSGAYEVMVQVTVPVSDGALKLCAANRSDMTDDLTMPVASGHAKNVIIDIVAFDPRSGRLIAASVKRGGGAQGGSAARQEPLEHRAAAMILRGMLVGAGWNIRSVEHVILDYYGRSGISSTRVVTGVELDAFFGVPVAAVVDAMTLRMAEDVERRTEEIARRTGVIFPEANLRARTGHLKGPEAVDPIPPPGEPARLPSLAECLSVLPQRPQGRRMSVVAG